MTNVPCPFHLKGTGPNVKQWTCASPKIVPKSRLKDVTLSPVDTWGLVFALVLLACACTIILKELITDIRGDN